LPLVPTSSRAGFEQDGNEIAIAIFSAAIRRSPRAKRSIPPNEL
jgi:hypothetical protein